MPDQKTPMPEANSRVSLSLMANEKELDYRFQVVSISVNKEFNKIAYAEIVLLDGDVALGDFEASNTDELLIGNKIKIQAGYDGHNETIFEGIIVKQTVKVDEETSNLIVTAKNKACKMAATRRNEVYSDKSDSDIIGAIIKRNGLDADVEDTSFVHESLTQYNCSDWDFINMRAEVNSMPVYTKEDKIIVKKPDLKGEAKLEINYGSVIFDFQAEMDGSNAFTEYKATSWSYINQEEKSVSPQQSDAGETKQGNFSSSDLAKAMKNDTCKIPIQSSFTDETELTGLLDSIVQRNNLSRITGKVKTYGYANIHPGDLIDLQRVGDRFNGKTIVSGVEHEISGGSWFTTIQFGIEKTEYAKKYDDINGLQASGMLPSINGLQTGKVQQISGDPLDEGRILVHLSNFASGENGVWARIATFYAGDERGFFFLPEPDDEVIVGFIDDHPDNAVILGTLNGSKLPPPLKADDKNNIKGIYTRSKIKLEFDDDKKVFSVITPGENTIIISDDEKSISLKDQNGNMIVMDGDGIKLKSDKKIVLEASGDVSVSGNNVELAAQGSFKAGGNSGAELSTSASAVIKGSMVQIN